MRKVTLLTAATASIAVALATATSASADTSGTTTATVTLSGGSLAITAPSGSVSLGSGSAADSISGQLGSVTVTDNRAALGGTWTSSVSSTNWANNTVIGAAAMDNSRVDYWSGAATASSGVAVTVPGQATAANKVALGAAATAFAATATTGNNSTTWNPTLTVNV